MKRCVLLVCMVILVSSVNAQSYICLAPIFINQAGTLPEQTKVSLEVGRQWDVFALGLDIGKTNVAKVAGKDTTIYIAARPNLNVFQQGKFTNTVTAGIGYIFNAKENIVTEMTAGIEYNITPLIHLNIFFGQYYYNGVNSASTNTFFGISVMKFFSPTKAKALITNNPK